MKSCGNSSLTLKTNIVAVSVDSRSTYTTQNKMQSNKSSSIILSGVVCTYATHLENDYFLQLLLFCRDMRATMPEWWWLL